jgi:hypothetical protein
MSGYVPRPCSIIISSRRSTSDAAAAAILAAARYSSINAKIGSVPEDARAAMGAAASAVAGIVASARTVPPAATPAACERNRRRVETAGEVVLFSVLA